MIIVNFLGYFYSDVFTIFKNFKLQVENLLSAKVKIVRADGGGEFVNTIFKFFSETLGSLIKLSVPILHPKMG